MDSIFGGPTEQIWLVANVTQSKSFNLSRSQLPVNQIKSPPSAYLKHDPFFNILGFQVKVRLKSFDVKKFETLNLQITKQGDLLYFYLIILNLALEVSVEMLPL